MRYRWTRWLVNASLFARFVPAITLMIPIYLAFRQLGLLNSIAGAIVALTGFLLPYAILISASYFDQISKELEDSARIDGRSRFGAFWRVSLPLAAPGLAS